MRRLLEILAFLLVVAACDGGAKARCVEVTDDAIAVYQELISTVDEMSLAEAIAAGEGFAIPGQEEMERRADALQTEADAAGCEDAELRRLLSERIIRLEARTVFGQALIEAIRQGGQLIDP